MLGMPWKRFAFAGLFYIFCDTKQSVCGIMGVDNNPYREDTSMIYQAHKGVSSENPENTMPAFIAAAEQGYKVIELDVSVTKDMEFVLLHDSTINRTARNEQGESLSEPIRIDEITYEEALAYDCGIGFSRKFRGTRIPLLREVLSFAKGHGLRLKIDNKYQRFPEAAKCAFFEL
jgi:glycerophosphoryl diester phosphodiesterase